MPRKAWSRGSGIFPIAVLPVLALLGGCATYGGGRVYVASPPPPILVETRPGPPGSGQVWISGYHRWEGRRYVWVPGYWTVPPHHRGEWIPGHWQETRRGWRWLPGHWR